MSKSLYNQPVMSLRSGQPIAVAVEPIINPHNLKIVGWWCKTPGASKQQVLIAEDVREFVPQGLAVNDEDVLSSTEDLIRHKEILDIHFELMNKPVKTKRQKIGKISDFAYENSGMFIQKLYVSHPITKLLAKEDVVIIDRTQIIEISDHHILVRDSDVAATDEEMAVAADAVPAS